ncbi:MAG: DUF211 domain-containing protein [Candidatus Lokiarchaeota archaeon]|nr:DUF211 domain-containing protein [Candidatus Lokiarchaeota archaeon]
MRIEYFLDVLKPHSPSIDYVAGALMDIKGISKVSVKLDELDQKTASLHINIIGNDVSLEEITEKLSSLNCAVHSIDEVLFEKE